jgi:adenylate cyclase
MSEKGVSAKYSILHHSFYVKIVFTFIGLIIFTVTPIVTYNYFKNKEIILELGDDLIDQTNKTVIEETMNYFLPASILPKISARLVETGVISDDNREQIELFTMSVLKSYPHICMFFIGDDQGNYTRAWSLPNGTMECRIIRRDIKPATNTFKYWNDKFEVFKTVTSTKINYDPRLRPWFIGVKRTKTNYWTDLYILFRNKKPGITSAYPVFDQKGKIVGIWGMDIELGDMSTFLQNLKIGKNGVAFIINDKNEIVSYPDSSVIAKEENGKLRPVRVEELGNKAIKKAFRNYELTGKNKSFIESQGKRYLASFTDFPKSFPAPWKVGLVVPEDTFIGQAKFLIRETLLICVGIFFIALIVAMIIARSISQPIKLLSEETKKIKDFHLEDPVEIRSYIKEIQSMRDAISAMKTGLQSFRKYVPAELVRRLVQTGEESRLGGQKKELTVFFSDIADFTPLAEQMSPEQLMLHLSEYFDELTKILSEHQGTVDKYIGDAILAFWGAPVPDEDHAFHACQAALICQEKLQHLNQQWQSEGKSPLDTRIGISTGETVVGNVGSRERMNYTVIGDNVNLASRLEGVNKLYRTNIIVNSATYEKVADKFWFRPLDIVAVKGKREGTTIYELAGRRTNGEKDETAEFCQEFTKGFNTYLARDWEGACRIFADLSNKYPLDAPTELFLYRCQQYRENPPGEDWQGIEYLKTK